MVLEKKIAHRKKSRKINDRLYIKTDMEFKSEKKKLLV